MCHRQTHVKESHLLHAAHCSFSGYKQSLSSTNSLSFTKPRGSVPYSQKLIKAPYHESVDSTPRSSVNKYSHTYTCLAFVKASWATRSTHFSSPAYMPPLRQFQRTCPNLRTCARLYITTYTENSRHIVVSIATNYDLDTPGIESRWRQDFPCRPDQIRPAPRITHPPA